MKSLVILLGLLVSTSVMADYCTAFLKDGHQTVRSFQGYGYSYGEACNQARRDCQWELNRIRYSGHNMYCTTENRHVPTPIKRSCTFQLVENDYRYGRHHRVISEHHAKGNTEYKACQKAERKCQREASYYGGYNQVSCVKKNVYNPGPGRDYVTRSCSARKVGRRNGRVFNTFYATATGYRGTGVKRQACNKALRKCEMSGGRGVCRVDNF